MPYPTLLLLALQLPAQARPSQGNRPSPAPKPPRAARPPYDSTRMNLSNSPGISHKTAMQAAGTYGKIGAGQPLNHADSMFLRQWSPAIIRAPDRTEELPKVPKAPRK